MNDSTQMQVQNIDDLCRVTKRFVFYIILKRQRKSEAVATVTRSTNVPAE